MVSNAARSQHTGHPSSSCAKRALDYAPYHECLSVAKDGPLQVWGGPLFGGDFAVLLLNRGPQNGTRQPITAYFATLGAWQYNRPRAQQYVVKSHSCMVIKNALRRAGAERNYEGAGCDGTKRAWSQHWCRDSDGCAARCGLLPPEPAVNECMVGGATNFRSGDDVCVF